MEAKLANKKNTLKNTIDGKSVSKEISKLENKPGKYSKDELQQIENFKKRLKNAPPDTKSLYSLIDMKQKNIGKDTLLSLAQMTEVTGSPDCFVQLFFIDQAFSTFRVIQSSDGSRDDESTLKTINIALALLNGINPQDEIEGMLAVQMVGVHNMAMDAMRLTMISDQYPEAKERNTSRAVKLLRTFTAQVEALNKHRRKGQQKVTVEHVNVNEGGQAIVGNVTQGGGAENEK